MSESPPAPPAPQRRRAWLRRVADVALIGAVVLGVGLWQTRDVPAGAAPDFEARLQDGRAISFAAWRTEQQPRAVALYFWADWCPICRASEGTVEGLSRDWPVLTVAMQSGDAARVSAVLAERGLAWPTVIDADGRIAAHYGLHGVPAWIVVDRHGRIRSSTVGYTTGPGLRLRLWWADAFSR